MRAGCCNNKKQNSLHFLARNMTSLFVMQEKMHLWQKRPCPIPLLTLMAVSVTHLMPLRLALMQRLMMDYMTLVDLCLESSYFEPDELQHLSKVSRSAQLVLVRRFKRFKIFKVYLVWIFCSVVHLKTYFGNGIFCASHMKEWLNGQSKVWPLASCQCL